MSRQCLQFMAAVAAALLVIESAASGQTLGVTPLPSLTRHGDGLPVCGLGREFHMGRRAALRELVGSGVVVLRGLPPPRQYVKFRQDKTFWYFTGVESPHAAAIIDAVRGEDLLFLPNRNESLERWEGEIWDVEDPWVADLTGFHRILPEDTLLEELRSRTADGTPLYVFLHPHTIQGGAGDAARAFLHRQVNDLWDGRLGREETFRIRLREALNIEVSDATHHVAQLRLIKTPEEIAAMRRAAYAGAMAMIEAIRSTAPERGEWEIEALMDFVHVMHGATGPAYHAIVGSGPNSCVLHYWACNRRMKDGEVLLVDYGPEFDFYTTDITRTWPVSGRFSPRQAELYDIVQEAQQAGIDAARPGASLRDINRAINRVFRRHGVTHLVRHGPCHLIGLDVHDIGTLDVLRPGMTLTVEPGLYSEEENIGIRIEDVILITEDGCEILTRDVPVDRREIEALMN